MSNTKQAPVQKGIGTSVPKSAPSQQSAPSPQTGPNGQSQSTNRGPQGNK